jgi:hypothetical protein
MREKGTHDGELRSVRVLERIYEEVRVLRLLAYRST